MRTAREHAIEEERFGDYNSWLRDFKKTLSQASNKRRNFWERIIGEGDLGLISVKDLPVSYFVQPGTITPILFRTYLKVKAREMGQSQRERLRR